MLIHFIVLLSRNLQVDQEQFVILSNRAGPAVTVDLCEWECEWECECECHASCLRL